MEKAEIMIFSIHSAALRTGLRFTISLCLSAFVALVPFCGYLKKQSQFTRIACCVLRIASWK
jgi:hypothetical protein